MQRPNPGQAVQGGYVTETPVQVRSDESIAAAPLSTSLPQPYTYRRPEIVEPDWTRFPGWKDVTASEWESVQWQRAHCVKNIKQLRALVGDLLEERFYAD